MNEGGIQKLLGPRWREIEDYAAQRGITFAEAVIEVVNKGLSFIEGQF